MVFLFYFDMLVCFFPGINCSCPRPLSLSPSRNYFSPFPAFVCCFFFCFFFIMSSSWRRSGRLSLGNGSRRARAWTGNCWSEWSCTRRPSPPLSPPHNLLGVSIALFPCCAAGPILVALRVACRTFADSIAVVKDGENYEYQVYSDDECVRRRTDQAIRQVSQQNAWELKTRPQQGCARINYDGGNDFFFPKRFLNDGAP